MNIDSFRISGMNNIYAIGLSDSLITIHSQQTRAICLARMLSMELEGKKSPKKSICIVGGGIAGLTCSLELLQQGWTDITILERMPDLLGVQNGCDTRWVHPHIINWPDAGSENEKSDNGVLDWEASTASNVTYQIEKDWLSGVNSLINKSRRGRPDRVLSLHVGVTYIYMRIVGSEVEAEWVRDSSVQPMSVKGGKVCNSEKRKYDYVVFASGFGIEQNSKYSYWRNEGYGQLHIDGLQRSYIVSGFGDGAISDLLRLTTKHFRPDRIIKEMSALEKLRPQLQGIKNRSALEGFDLMGEFLSSSQSKGIVGGHWKDFIENIGARKRQDTKVYLQYRLREGFSAAFNQSKASFFNKLMLFALYKNGAFQYIDGSGGDDVYEFASRNDIPKENVILRRGVDRQEIVQNMLEQNPGEVLFKLQSYSDCKKYVDATNSKGATKDFYWLMSANMQMR
ncbi:FAD-dependent oxidoreductase [Pseudomonas oryzihabitans]|uniref:FAD-dependent oxidoreductase n=1 Tax=Pseudomonas oryzihabitans TaxID=47885 RepID=UPI003CFCA342